MTQGPNPPTADLYELLGVPVDADVETINVAYRRLARLYHPDATGTSETTLLMTGLNVAREWLTTPETTASDRIERARDTLGPGACWLVDTWPLVVADDARTQVRGS